MNIKSIRLENSSLLSELHNKSRLLFLFIESLEKDIKDNNLPYHEYLSGKITFSNHLKSIKTEITTLHQSMCDFQYYGNDNRIHAHYYLLKYSLDKLQDYDKELSFYKRRGE
jgi:hypothetical protein